MAANVDVDVELSGSVPVPGLQLLAFFRFVTQRRQYSRGQWEDMGTERQIRLLVEDIGVETPVPAHFSHLASAQTQLASTGAPLRDALGTEITPAEARAVAETLLHLAAIAEREGSAIGDTDAEGF